VPVFSLALSGVRSFHAASERQPVTAIFITATGANVGTTFIAAALIRHLRQMGHQVDAIKPIVSGYDAGQAAASEPALLLAALGVAFSPEAVDRISPWRFRGGLSPDLATNREGRDIDVDQVIAFCRGAVEKRRDILLIEGLDGIMVPLDEERTILDVMMTLRVPLILVTGSYLGAISHTLTALDALFRRDMNILATIVSETLNSPVPLDDAVASIARFTDPVIGVPHSKWSGGNAGSASFDRLFGGRPPRTPDAG
jgi:dethiobiotin synthetase